MVFCCHCLLEIDGPVATPVASFFEAWQNTSPHHRVCINWNAWKSSASFPKTSLLLQVPNFSQLIKPVFCVGGLSLFVFHVTHRFVWSTALAIFSRPNSRPVLIEMINDLWRRCWEISPSNLLSYKAVRAFVKATFPWLWFSQNLIERLAENN